MRRGLERDEFVVYYQPKLDLSTMTVCGMEALVRWRRDVGSMISPGEFIVVAEETGLIIEMGRQVLEKSCRFAVDLGWNGRKMKVAVNLSGKQFADKYLVDSVADILAKTGLSPANLELEVTETSIISDIKVAIA